jgi:hypothetical protein
MMATEKNYSIIVKQETKQNNKQIIIPEWGNL